MICTPPAACPPPIVHELRTQLRRERNRTRALRVELARARRAVRPTVHHAIHLAAQAYGVDHSKMLRVARCESTFRPWAASGPYQGLYQADRAFWAATPFSAFPRTDPYANALATAQVVSRRGWGKWPVCGKR